MNIGVFKFSQQIFGALSILALLSGCNAQSLYQSNVRPELSGEYPANYKRLIKQYVQMNFKDPDSIKNASISKPIQGQVLLQQGWIVCLRANAKNSYGGYVGLSNTNFLIKNSEILLAQDWGQAPDCSHGSPYEKWSELEGKNAN